MKPLGKNPRCAAMPGSTANPEGKWTKTDCNDNFTTIVCERLPGMEKPN